MSEPVVESWAQTVRPHGIQGPRGDLGECVDAAPGQVGALQLDRLGRRPGSAAEVLVEEGVDLGHPLPRADVERIRVAALVQPEPPVDATLAERVPEFEDHR
ncbi:hypothetical protein [Ornithinimicrobium sp. Y1694]|uniref:hypothetical protein n=1 Tax=Ornithinimicrobium sp. Y1694 TaxID=3418590 RepID=UPI003CF49C25